MEKEENNNINTQTENNDNSDIPPQIQNNLTYTFDSNSILTQIDKDIITEFENIKKTGKTKLEWKELQNKFIYCYKLIIKGFKLNSKNTNDNIDNDIIDCLNSLTKIPFTLQRMAELIIEPQLFYSSPEKYNNAFKKLVNIEFE